MTDAGPRRSTAWWSSRMAVRHVNAVLGGPSSAVFGATAQSLIADFLGRDPPFSGAFPYCGAGTVMLDLLTRGQVARARGIEPSGGRLRKAAEAVRTRDLKARARLERADPLETPAVPTHDLVVWSNALARTADPADALAWSREVLVPGGRLVIDDYLGPKGLRLNDEDLAFANALRSGLPGAIFDRAGDEAPRVLSRDWLVAAAGDDPGIPAPDETPLAALDRLFPGARIIPAGGLGFHIALNGLYAHVDPASESETAAVRQVLDEDAAEVRRRPDSTLYGVVLTTV